MQIVSADDTYVILDVKNGIEVKTCDADFISQVRD
jgi:hypothetical protein